jgi:hypothetical protein
MTVCPLPIRNRLPFLDGESVPLPVMVTVMPVTAPNVFSGLMMGGTETVPVTVIAYSLLLPPLLTPFTASIHVAALFTFQEAVWEKLNTGTLASIAAKINIFFMLLFLIVALKKVQYGVYTIYFLSLSNAASISDIILRFVTNLLNALERMYSLSVFTRTDIKSARTRDLSGNCGNTGPSNVDLYRAIRYPFLPCLYLYKTGILPVPLMSAFKGLCRRSMINKWYTGCEALSLGISFVFVSDVIF